MLNVVKAKNIEACKINTDKILVNFNSSVSFELFSDSCLNEGNEIAFNCTYKNDFVGGIYGKLHNNRSWAEIEFLAVNDSYRKSGVGSNLIKEFEKECMTHNVGTIKVETHDFQAEGFYRKQGFKVVGTYSGCPKGFKTYILTKSLE